MDDFPSNSRTPRIPVNQRPKVEAETIIEGPKLESVITGKVVRRKKPLGRRLMDTFFSGDGVVKYLINDVLLPAAKDLVVDFVKQGIEKSIYGDVRSPGRTGYRGGSASRTYTSYSGYAGSTARTPSQTPQPARRPVRDPSSVELDDVIVETQFEATTAIDTLYETLQEYGVATVANLYELVGQTATVTDYKWGWTNLDDLTAQRVRGGYRLILPPVEHIR